MTSSNPESDVAERLASRKPIPAPTPAYLPKAGSPLTVDQTAYSAIQSSPRILLEEFTLPIRSGRAWKAPAGSIVKISTPEGPQVGEFICLSTRFQADVRQVISMSGILIIRGSVSGLLEPNNCMRRTSQPMIVCGHACRT